VTITWYLYEHTGDVTIIEKYYKGIQAWVDCLTTQYQQTGLAHMYHHWGDWNPTQETRNESLVASYPFLRDVYTFVNMSKILNQTDNVQRYSQLYQQLSDEFHRVFYNATIEAYADGSQAMNILALDLPNVVPTSLRPAVVNSLVNNIISTGYFSGGIVSVNALFPLLSKEGHHDLALKVAQNTSFPSYGFMFTNNIQNATTTWERWDTLPVGATSSLNHHMFNTIGAWFYRYLAGIHLNALQTITIYPRMSYDPDLLTHVQAEVVTIKGPVQVEWTRLSQNAVALSTSIPNNLDAIVTFDRLMEKGQYVKLMCDNEVIWMRGEMILSRDVRGVSDLSENELTGAISIRVGSGDYTFAAYWQ
jgi:alpha-L-rhamnosidase